MSKFVLGIALASLLAIGAIAYAHGPGGWSGGHMMGPRYGDWPCPMMEGGGPGYGYDQKFLDETAELRKQLHNKRFEYAELLRDPKTAPETLTELEKEILELEGKIFEKAPRRTYRGFRGYGPWW